MITTCLSLYQVREHSLANATNFSIAFQTPNNLEASANHRPTKMNFIGGSNYQQQSQSADPVAMAQAEYEMDLMTDVFNR